MIVFPGFVSVHGCVLSVSVLTPMYSTWSSDTLIRSVRCSSPPPPPPPCLRNVTVILTHTGVVPYAADAARNSPHHRAEESLCDHDSAGMATACLVQAAGEGGHQASSVGEGSQREGRGDRYQVMIIIRVIMMGDDKGRDGGGSQGYKCQPQQVKERRETKNKFE